MMTDPLQPLSHTCAWQAGKRCFGHQEVIFDNVELGRDSCHAQCHQTDWCERVSWTPVDGPEWAAGCFLFGGDVEYRYERQGHEDWTSVSVLRPSAARR